jgi:hypothetical protein
MSDSEEYDVVVLGSGEGASPTRWSDRLDDFFVDYKLKCVLGVGHFTALEATDEFAAAIKERLKDWRL